MSNISSEIKSTSARRHHRVLGISMFHGQLSLVLDQNGVVLKPHCDPQQAT
ncbi:hypothetical protein AB5N19_09090 [Seiridium cardinale]|uniref:Uncharacterized protein n=1 Tax=Seiridium cardinale TaxID=138064 RepID=A0ABR2Y710_9PEZI